MKSLCFDTITVVLPPCQVNKEDKSLFTMLYDQMILMPKGKNGSGDTNGKDITVFSVLLLVYINSNNLCSGFIEKIEYYFLWSFNDSRILRSHKSVWCCCHNQYCMPQPNDLLSQK